MIAAVVNEPFEALLLGAPAGLGAGLTVQVYDPSDSAQILPATSVGITEPQPGTYRVVLTVTAAGTFLVRWEWAGVSAEEELTVTAAATSRLLATVPELQAYLRSGDAGPSVAGARGTDETFLVSLLAGATLRAERYTRREFLPTPAHEADGAVTRTFTRTFTRRGGLFSVSDVREVDEVVADGVLVDPAGYALVGAPGEPSNLLSLTIAARRIVVTGRYGFAAVPADVKLAVLAMAARGFHDAQARLGDRVVDPDGGVTSYFRQLPVEAKGVLDSYLAPTPILVA